MPIAHGNEYVNWLRQSAPYINAHRNKTFVVYFGGEAILDPAFYELLHDLALLNCLGIRLVIVHGIRPQIDKRIHSNGSQAAYFNGLRITDALALDAVKEAAGTARVEIEAILSMGLSGSPLAGAQIRVTSANFLTAKPVGVREGIDFQHTGEVRRVDVDGIRSALDREDIVLLSAVGYSPSGEIFNLRSEEVATATAIALKADKLIFLTEAPVQRTGESRPISQLTTDEAQDLLGVSEGLPETVRSEMKAAVHACIHGVERVHCLDRHHAGGVLLELFTRDGVGTLISLSPFELIRSAKISDISGIQRLITPLENSGVLIHRSKERIEMEVGDYLVIERDGLIIGCAALHVYPGSSSAELACLVLHQAYQGEQRGRRLVAKVEEKARKSGIQTLFVLTTQTAHWFLERGFEPCSVEDLPEERRVAYNTHRNSKVLSKSL